MTPREAFAHRLDALLDEQSATAKRLSAELGHSQGWLSNLRNGAREPNITSLAIICEKLNVSADYLVGLTDDPRRVGAEVHTSDETAVTPFRRKDDRVGRMTAAELARFLAKAGIKLDERTTLEELIRIVVRVMRAEQAG